MIIPLENYSFMALFFGTMHHPLCLRCTRNCFLNLRVVFLTTKLNLALTSVSGYQEKCMLM